jgi:hypothetical protein
MLVPQKDLDFFTLDILFQVRGQFHGKIFDMQMRPHGFERPLQIQQSDIGFTFHTQSFI